MKNRRSDRIKRLLTVLLAFAAIFAFAACGGENETSKTPEISDVSQISEPSDESGTLSEPSVEDDSSVAVVESSEEPSEVSDEESAEESSEISQEESSEELSDKDFTKADMTITLTNKFTEKDLLTQTAYYESNDAIVTALKEGFDLFEQVGLDTDITPKQYAELCITANQLSGVTVDSTDKYAHFSYKKTINGEDFSYEAYCFRTNDAFWLIQFACYTKDESEMKPTFEKYANSVKFQCETSTEESSDVSDEKPAKKRKERIKEGNYVLTVYTDDTYELSIKGGAVIASGSGYQNYYYLKKFDVIHITGDGARAILCDTDGLVRGLPECKNISYYKMDQTDVFLYTDEQDNLLHSLEAIVNENGEAEFIEYDLRGNLNKYGEKLEKLFDGFKKALYADDYDGMKKYATENLIDAYKEYKRTVPNGGADNPTGSAAYILRQQMTFPYAIYPRDVSGLVYVANESEGRIVYSFKAVYDDPHLEALHAWFVTVSDGKGGFLIDSMIIPAGGGIYCMFHE